MTYHRFFIEEKYGPLLAVKGGDARHMSKVLRLQPKDKVQVVTDDGITALAEITAIEKEEVNLRPLEILAQLQEPRVEVTLAQGLAKGEKMETIIQKAVELGAAAIVPLTMEHSVVQLKGKRAEEKVKRWQKIAQAAAAQAQRQRVPRVALPKSLEELLAKDDSSLKLLCYECEDHLGLKSALEEAVRLNILQKVLLIIGPEGGISPAELAIAEKAGVKTVSLGHRILRVETAALAALTAVFFAAGELGEY